MNKINGYTEEEAKSLVEYIWAGKQAGKTLTYLFETYGAQHGRAKGSVRNYYYALMKNPKKDERVVKLLDGKQLSVEQILEFTDSLVFGIKVKGTANIVFIEQFEQFIPDKFE